MALIQLGPMVSGIKGSIGGTTYAKTRYGYIAKQKPQPVNPSSPEQAAQRSFMTEAVNNWKNVLTSTEIASWIHGAQLHKRSHIGQGFELSGINLYCAHYCLMRKASLTPKTECTIFEGAPPVELPTISDEAITGKQEISAIPMTDANLGAFVYATNAVSTGIHYKSIPFVFNQVINTATPVPILVDVVYPASGISYNLFYGIRVFDIRGSVSSLLTSMETGTML